MFHSFYGMTHIFFLFSFHVVASKGNLECLNAILIHGVDITTTDTAGTFAAVVSYKTEREDKPCPLLMFFRPKYDFQRDVLNFLFLNS